MTQAEALAYVRGNEYRKELARLLGRGLAERDAVDLLLADAGTASSVLLDELIDELAKRGLVSAGVLAAMRHARELGLPAIGNAAEVAQAQILTVLDEAGRGIAAALGDAVRSLERARASGQGIGVVRAALSTQSGRDAILSSLRAVLGRTGAAVVGGAESSVLTAAAYQHAAEADPEEPPLLAWQTRDDGNVCEDIFENSCLPRHGRELPIDEWEVFGLPQAETLLCTVYAKGGGSNCRCVVEAADNTGRQPGPVAVADAVLEGRKSAAREFERAA